MRRIILLDQTETPDYVKYFGAGLGNEIYLIQDLQFKTPEEQSQILAVGPGDAVLLVGAAPFKYLQEFYHFGIRNENYFDCSKLTRLSIEGGAFVKVIVDYPTTATVSEFMDPGFTTPRVWPDLKQGILKTYDEAIKFLAWLSALRPDTPLGFDYEASGLPLDEWFELSGASLCTSEWAGFISLTDIRRTASPEQYQDVLSKLGKFLEERQSYIWTYNMQYEFQVSFRMLGVDLMNLADASVFNVLGGNHLKRYSLKWTANSVLGTTVWDTDFDRLEGLLDGMYFETVGKLKKDRTKVLKVDQVTYKNTPEWAEICRLYPKYVSEFELLISEYFGCPFMNIPADILGYYCNLDSFYTLQIFLQEGPKYSETARETFLDNIRLGARLHSCGMYKDEAFRNKYQTECLEQMVWGITYCATARCKIKMNIHGAKMANIKKFHPVVQKLIKSGNFYNGNAIDILKYIMSNNIDTMDTNDHGLNEGALMMTYGPDFADAFIDIVRDARTEVKMKPKIDEGIVRKKKILGIIAEKIIPLLGLDKIKDGDKKLIELESYIYFEKAYNELIKISRTQLADIRNIPLTITCFGGKTMTLLEYSDYVSNNFFKCKSPIENDAIAADFARLYKAETAYLSAIFESTQQLTGAEKFYASQGCLDPQQGFQHFMTEWEHYCNQAQVTYTYPFKVFELALTYYKDPTLDQPKDMWTNFNGFIAQSQFWPDLKKQYDLYGMPFQEQDLTDNFYFMRKLVLNYLMYKKYAKVLSTYLEGMFQKTDLWVIEDPVTRIPLRRATSPDEPGAVLKMFAKYEINTKSSKRWSSGYHTIVSHSDIKSTINTPPGCLLTYFDISSAEVKSAGFASGDPDLIDKFVNNVDIYVYTGKLYLPDGPWDTDPAFRGLWRKRFKTIFLGILYGLGKRSLAERLNCSEEEAERIIESVYQAFPKLRGYVRSQQQYPFQNGGYVNTFFGDKLKVDEWKYYLAAKTDRERKGIKARIERLGVNLPIQGGTSSAMAAGFFNDVRVAKQEGWELCPIIVVHDSNTNYIPIEKLFEIRSFYDKNFTDFCYKSTGIKLLFDLLCGVDYETACEMKQLGPDQIEFSGNAHSLRLILEKIAECPSLQVQSSLGIPELVPAYIEHPIDRFIREKGTSMIKDTSWYKIVVTKMR